MKGPPVLVREAADTRVSPPFLISRVILITVMDARVNSPGLSAQWRLNELPPQAHS